MKSILFWLKMHFSVFDQWNPFCGCEYLQIELNVFSRILREIFPLNFYFRIFKIQNAPQLWPC